MPGNPHPLAPGQDDYPSIEAVLAGAIAWTQTLTPSEEIADIRFGQRDPVTVGKDRYYWYATIRSTVHCGVYEQREALASPSYRIGVAVQAWRLAYYPEGTRS
jgi:hypothetical protein